MAESNGTHIRESLGSEEKGQSQLSVDAQPLSPRGQTSQRFADSIVPGAVVLKESRQLDESSLSESQASGDHLQSTEDIQRETWFTNKKELKMPSAFEEWCFNNFLTDLAKNISNEELDILKGLFISKNTTFLSLINLKARPSISNMTQQQSNV